MECEGPRNCHGLNFQELLLKHCFNLKCFFCGISSFVTSFYSVTTDNKTWGKNYLLEYMSLYLLLYFGPSTVFVENSKIIGRVIQTFKATKFSYKQFSHLFFTPKTMMSYSIFSIFCFLQKYLQIRLYTLLLLTGMGVMAMYPGDNWFSPLNTSHPSHVWDPGEWGPSVA